MTGNVLPCAYTRFLGSEMFTIVAGPSLKTFRVHKQLLAEISPELEGHVFNEMKEGRENTMEMKDISEETMYQFLEFCYTGGYADSVDGETEKASNISTYKKYTRTLIPNAKLYVLGDMYNIPRLKDLAFERICAAIESIGEEGLQQPWVPKIYIQLMIYACENIPERTGDGLDPLLAYLANCAAWGLTYFRGDEEFLGIFSTGGRTDFTRKFLGDIIPGAVMGPPWKPAPPQFYYDGP